MFDALDLRIVPGETVKGGASRSKRTTRTRSKRTARRRKSQTGRGGG